MAIIGGGPAGLMAAEVLIASGFKVDVYESMPTVGRKFLRAGLGGLNITHSEVYEVFCKRYGDRQEELAPYLEKFKPENLRNWVHELGIETFVGTSGRVFPKEMKAAPLLRSWLHRLRSSGVSFHHQHRWSGFSDSGELHFSTLSGQIVVRADATVLALGGASWPQLGSTGRWLEDLAAIGVETSPWRAANCGFDVWWSEHLGGKFDGAPLKSVTLTFCDLNGKTASKQGELLIKKWGVEGSLIYAFADRLRDYIARYNEAKITLDLVPGKSYEKLLAALNKSAKSGSASRSMSRHLQTCLGDDALKRALLYETMSKDAMASPENLARQMKAMPLILRSCRPIAEAISSAGGVTFSALDENLMLKALPGVFAAGEMLDWEAPTGGYLLTACLATGLAAGAGARDYLST